MRRISTFEHGWLSIGSAGDLSTTEADALASVESLLPKRCLEWGRNRVKFRQFCGVVQIQQLLQIEVLPKVFPEQTSEQQRTTLIEMLHIAGEIEGLSPQQAGLSTSSPRLLDVFIRHFMKLLEIQLQQGLLRDYRDVDDTLDQVRGRIDLIRQQRENLFKPQRLACRFNELVADIPVNRLLHTALLCVNNLASSPMLRQHILSMRMHFGGIGVLSKGDHIPRADDLNRMQRRYSNVVNLARLFLAGQYLDARAGEQQVYSLLFDMNKLFERFVAVKLRPTARRQGLSLIEQGPKKYLGKDSAGRGRLRMRPDISFLNAQNRRVAILDAKWKLLDSGKPLASLSSADLYQLSTYASAYRCDQVMLLYPKQLALQDQDQIILHLNTEVRLSVVPVSLNGSSLSLPVRTVVEALSENS